MYNSRDCKDSKFIYSAVGHVVTENLKIISDPKIRNITSKYRFPSNIDFNRCREEIHFFGSRWCKRESVECNALQIAKIRTFKLMDKRIKSYS